MEVVDALIQLFHDKNVKATLLAIPMQLRDTLHSLQVSKYLKFLIETVCVLLAL